MNDYQQGLLDAFDAAVDIWRDTETMSCVMRFEVNPDGTDKTGAKDYDAINAPSPDQLSLVAGGFMADYRFSLSARRDDFKPLPNGGELFLHDGRVSRILTVESSDLSPVVVFHCGTPNQ